MDFVRAFDERPNACAVPIQTLISPAKIESIDPEVYVWKQSRHKTGFFISLLSSRHEGQEMVVLEAAACARTSVGTAVGLLPDLVPAVRTVPVNDSRALAQTVFSLLQDPNRRNDMGLAAREEVEANYSLGRNTEAFWKLYNQIDDSACIGEVSEAAPSFPEET